MPRLLVHWIDDIGDLSHLYARNTSFAVVSRAPLEKLRALQRKRLGWTIPWYSSHGSDFNYDFHVTLDPSVAPVEYNFKDAAELERMDPAWRGWSGEEQGVSAFLRRGDRVFHTYSAYARGIENLIGILQLARPHRRGPPRGLGIGAAPWR